MMETKMTTSLEAYTKLKETGLSEAQARVIAESIQTHSEMTLQELATKADFDNLETKVTKLETSVGKLEGNFLRLENDIHWLTRLFMGSTLVILLGLALNFLHH